MKLLKFFVLLIFCCSPHSLNAQMKGYYATGEKRFEIDTANGMLNGKCILYNTQGNVLLKGKYKNNQKQGTWTIYDSIRKGKTRVKYNYINSYEFEILEINNKIGKPIKRISETDYLLQRYNDSIDLRKEWNFRTKNVSSIKNSVKKIDSLLAIPQSNYGYLNYTPERDGTGLIIYSPFWWERDFLSSKKTFSLIEKTTYNNFIFENDNLYNHIKSYINRENPKIYKTSDFKSKIEKEQHLKKLEENQAVVAYKTVEFWYFDKRYFNSYSRLIGICPVLYDTSLKKYEDLGWVLYSEFRTTLADKKVISKTFEINPLEDVFHYRQFSSFIYFCETIAIKEEQVDVFNDLKKYRNENINIMGDILYLEYFCRIFMSR